MVAWLHADTRWMDALPPPPAMVAPLRTAPESRQGEEVPTGDALGAWRLVRVLARGGMGSILLAERADGLYRQRAAIKRALRGEHADRNAAALVRERAILASLDHPGIARVLDGGVDAQGAPWFAMEYVDGEPLHDWCARRQCTLETKIDLVLQAADALAHAHRQGVVHGDVTPSNLLVSPRGHLRLIDFGVASQSQQDGLPARPFAYSPMFAAPEIQRGLGVSAESDLYAMGAVIALIADLQDPTEPAGKPQGDRALRSIVKRCMHPDPDRRYGDMDALHADLKAWLRKRPVSTLPGIRHRLVQFFRRNRRAALASAALLVMLSATATWFAYRQRLAAVREAAANAALLRHVEQWNGSRAALAVRSSTLSPESALRGLEAAIRQDPAINRSVAVRVRGLRLLARARAALGDFPTATRFAEHVLALSPDGGDGSTESVRLLASLLNAQGHFSRADALLRDALTRSQRAEADPEQILLQAEYALTRWNLGEQEEGLALLNLQLAHSRRSGMRTDATLVPLLIQRGRALTELYRTDEARTDLESAIALAGEAHADLRDEARRDLIRVLLIRDELDAARTLARRAHLDVLRLYGPQHPETARAMVMLAQSEFADGQTTRVLHLARRARRILETNGLSASDAYAESLLLIGYAWPDPLDRGRLEEYRKAVALLERAHGRFHSLTWRAKHAYGLALIYVGYYRNEPARIRQAIAMYEQVLADGRHRGVPMPLVEAGYVQARVLTGAPATALAPLFARARQQMRACLGEDHRYAINLEVDYGDYLWSQRRPTEARRTMTAVVRHSLKRPDATLLRAAAGASLHSLGTWAEQDGELDAAGRFYQACEAWVGGSKASPVIDSEMARECRRRRLALRGTLATHPAEASSSRH
jgi:serine/threonine-protein kinase